MLESLDNPTPSAQPEPLDRITGEEVREHGSDEQLAALYGAMAAAKAEFRPVPKNHEGQTGHQKFRYAPLATLQDCTVAALSKHGLSVIQPFSIVGGMACLRTILSHEGGGRLVARFCFEPASDIRQLGSQSTYYRRYAYQSVLCVDSGDDADNDGQSMPSGAKAWPAKENPAPPRKPPVNELVRPERAPKRSSPKPTAEKPPQETTEAPQRKTTAQIEAELDERTAAAKKSAAAKAAFSSEDLADAHDDNEGDPGLYADDKTDGPGISADTGIQLNKLFRQHRFTGPQVVAMCREVTGREPDALKQPGGEALAQKLMAHTLNKVAASG